MREKERERRERTLYTRRSKGRIFFPPKYRNDVPALRPCVCLSVCLSVCCVFYHYPPFSSFTSPFSFLSFSAATARALFCSFYLAFSHSRSLLIPLLFFLPVPFPSLFPSLTPRLPAPNVFPDSLDSTRRRRSAFFQRWSARGANSTIPFLPSSSTLDVRTCIYICIHVRVCARITTHASLSDEAQRLPSFFCLGAMVNFTISQ